MSRIVKILSIFILYVVVSTAAFGQGAHYTYPYSIECPDRLVQSGETVTINAKFPSGHTGDFYEPVYSWSVSMGTVVSGQGTPSIRLEVPNDESGAINVILERSFIDPHYIGVQKTASCSIGIEARQNAVLVDEMATRGNNCEDHLARLDNYFSELANNPNDQGFVVIYQTPESRSAVRNREYQVKNHTNIRKFDMSRITIVLGGVREEAMVQLWRVPPGAANPKILESNAEYKDPEPPARPADAPYIYATEYGDGIPGCNGPVYDLEAYAAVLNESGARGNVVIGQPTQKLFREREREIRAGLEEHGIARTRIRTFFKKVPADSVQEYTELWVVPAKQATLPLRSPDRYTVIGNRNIEPRPSTEMQRSPDKVGATNDAAVPAARPTVPKIISGGVLNGKAISLPEPLYPAKARAAGASGSINVEILIDEAGDVISAKAVSGHRSLRSVSEIAARQAKIPQTTLSGVSIKVSGILVYDFTDNE